MTEIKTPQTYDKRVSGLPERNWLQHPWLKCRLPKVESILTRAWSPGCCCASFLVDCSNLAEILIMQGTLLSLVIFISADRPMSKMRL